MLKWFKRPEAKLNIINAVELRQNANYILLADSRHISHKDLAELKSQLKKAGIRNVVGFLLQGGDQQAIQDIDRPTKRKAKKEK